MSTFLLNIGCATISSCFEPIVCSLPTKTFLAILSSMLRDVGFAPVPPGAEIVSHECRGTAAIFYGKDGSVYAITCDDNGCFPLLPTRIANQPAADNAAAENAE